MVEVYCNEIKCKFWKIDAKCHRFEIHIDIQTKCASYEKKINYDKRVK